MRKYLFFSSILVFCFFAITIVTLPMTVQAIDEVTATPTQAEIATATPEPTAESPVATSTSVDINSLLNQAYQDLQNGHFSSVIEQMNTVLDIDPQNVSAFFMRGVAYTQLAQYSKAIDDFSAAIEFAPWDESLFVVRGDAYNLSGKVGDAMFDYDTAISINPMRSDVFSRRSDLYYQLGDNKAGDTDKLIAQGLQAYSSKDSSSALNFLKEAINSANNDLARASAYYARGMVYFSTGDGKSASEDFTQAIDANPDLHNAYLARGIYYRQSGDIAAAGQDFYKRITTHAQETIEMKMKIGVRADLNMVYRRVYAISFDAVAGQHVTITASDTGGTFTDPLIALVAPSGVSIAGDDDFGGGLNSKIEDFVLPETGTYTLYLSHAEGGRDYGFQGVVRVEIKEVVSV